MSFRAETEIRRLVKSKGKCNTQFVVKCVCYDSTISHSYIELKIMSLIVIKHFMYD
jgi:hypothetical protein